MEHSTKNWLFWQINAITNYKSKNPY